MNTQGTPAPEGNGSGDGTGDGGTPAAPRLSDTPEQQEQQPPIAIHAQYIKDLSFEAPNIPGVFRHMQNTQPEVSVNVDLQARKIDNGPFELLLRINAECKFAGEVAFLVELSYGGLITLSVPEANVRPILLIECPRLLFPFARQIIANTTANGGFPPLLLTPVDFAALYQREVHAKQQQAAEEAGATAGKASE